MRTFWLCFVPLFVAVDAIGALPIYFGMTSDIESRRLRKIVLLSAFTATVVAMLFLYVGEGVLRLLGITVEDFLVAGGVLLLLMSVRDLLVTEVKPLIKVNPEELGPVPLGVPLIVGPAVLTTIMLLVREYGFLPTTLATIANIIIAAIMFSAARPLLSLLGNTGTKIFSKVANLFLAAIAVMMLRKGIFAFINLN